MDKAILVKESQGFIDGRRLLEELDRQSFPVVAALWHRLQEYDEEKLVVVSPEADQGNLPALIKIQNVLRALPESSLQLSDIYPIGVQSKRFQELRREVEGVLGLVPSEKRPSFGGYTSEGTFVYRWPSS